MCAQFTKVCVIILMCAGLTVSLKAIFERVRTTYINEKYAQYVFVNVSRYERKGDYYLNYEFISKYPFSNNVTVGVQYVDDLYILTLAGGLVENSAVLTCCLVITALPPRRLINLVFYEFVSYRYERSFIEFHYNLCEFINDPLIGAEFKKQGLECPVKPGKLYSFKNFTVHVDDFPNVFPFEKGLIKIELNLTDSNKTLIAEAFLYLSFKNRDKGKKHN